MATICAEWLHPECTTYAAAPGNAKPFKPRYWWGGNTLYTLGLAVMPAERLRALFAALGMAAPVVFLLAVAARSRRALFLLAPLAPLAWWSQASFGLWSMETAMPQVWAWLTGALAAWTARWRHAVPLLLACGMVQGYLWSLDTAEALGFGLAVLAVYAVVRDEGEHRGLRASVTAGSAYVAGFALAVLGGIGFRHVVYETTIALAHPEMSGYVWTNFTGQMEARRMDNAESAWAKAGIGGSIFLLAWTWSLLTTMAAGKALLLHAACYMAMAAHLGAYLVAGTRQALGQRTRWPAYGATAAGALVLGALWAQTTLWNDDWVRVGRATVLIPAVAWVWALVALKGADLPA